MSRKYDYLYKILLLGNSDVGKTCFLKQYTDKSFTENHYTTIGIDFKIKIIELYNRLFKLQIWDSGGVERFHKITKTYIPGAHGIIIIYDVTDRNSFKNVKYWIKMIEENFSRKKPTFLVGTKIDKPYRVVTTEEGNKLAEELRLKFFECSSKNGINVDNIFKRLVKTIYENNIQKIHYDKEFKISILGDESTGKSSILNYYINEEFINKPYSPTKGFELISKNIETDDDIIIRLLIYDTEKNSLFLKQYYKDSDGIILVYDVTNKSSFDNLKNWIKEIKNESSKNTPIFIIGNKTDDIENRIITTEQGKKFVEENGLILCECSAKNGVNINFIFGQLITKIYQNFMSNENKLTKQIKEKIEINTIFSFKILILGDEYRGKSIFLNCYQNNSFEGNYFSGINEKISFLSANIKTQNGQKVNLQIYEMSGLEEYRSSLKEHYKDSKGIVLIYDVTNKKSFDNLKNWIKDILNECPKFTSVFLLGNKIDDIEHRVITKEQGEKLAQENEFIFSECSIKSGNDLNFILIQLAENIIKNNEYNIKKKLMKYLSF